MMLARLAKSNTRQTWSLSSTHKITHKIYSLTRHVLNAKFKLIERHVLNAKFELIEQRYP